MHLFLCERGTERFLFHELERSFPGAAHIQPSDGIVQSDFPLQSEQPLVFVFARQFLPHAQSFCAESIAAYARKLFVEILSLFPEDQPWRLHVLARYASGSGGENRSRLIYQAITALLSQKRRCLLRSLVSSPSNFNSGETLVQLLLLSPERGYLSVASSPNPYLLRRFVSPFIGGEIPIANDKAAPSRAFSKLVEAEARFGRQISRGESCVDLGAAPGSWSYVALQRGARVVAVDRAPLRPDLMSHPRLQFQKGDAFRFEPKHPFDWLLCDVIAAPERNIELLLLWCRKKWAKRFVVTIKFKGTEDYGILERLKYALPGLCQEYFVTHLCANRNEVCAFGSTL